MLGIEVNVNGKVSGVKMVCIEMGELDVKGCWWVEIVVGFEYVVLVDVVVMVFGFCLYSMEWLVKYSVELDL